MLKGLTNLQRSKHDVMIVALAVVVGENELGVPASQ